MYVLQTFSNKYEKETQRVSRLFPKCYTNLQHLLNADRREYIPQSALPLNENDSKSGLLLDPGIKSPWPRQFLAQDFHEPDQMHARTISVPDRI